MSRQQFSRRAALVASAGVAVMSAGAALPLSAALAPKAALAERLDAYDRYTRQMNASLHSEAEWESWLETGKDLHLEIERLPNTPENIRLKARAVLGLVDGDFTMMSDDTTVDRLISQIVAALALEDI